MGHVMVGLLAGSKKMVNEYSCVCLHSDRRPQERKENLLAFKVSLPLLSMAPAPLLPSLLLSLLSMAPAPLLPSLLLSLLSMAPAPLLPSLSPLNGSHPSASQHSLRMEKLDF